MSNPAPLETELEAVVSVTETKSDEPMITTQNGNDTNDQRRGSAETETSEISHFDTNNGGQTNNIVYDDDMQTELQPLVPKIPKEAQPGKYEFLFYLIFTIIFTIIAMISRGESDFGYSQVQSLRNMLVKRLFFTPLNGVGEVTFEESGHVSDIYNYMDQVLFPFLFGNENGEYNANPNLEIKTNDDFLITKQSVLLGGLRLKQVRYKEVECPEKEFKDYICYDVTKMEEEKDYKGYKFYTEDKLLDQDYRGKFGSYPGGGYIQDFNKSGGIEPNGTLIQSRKILQELAKMEWIDGGTRFVVLDFNCFNPTSSLHICVRIMWETQGGNVFPNDEFKSWKFLRYSGSDGVILTVLHIVFFIMLLGFTIMEVINMYKLGCICRCCGLCPNKYTVKWTKAEGCTKHGYWGSTMWHAIDIINYSIFYIWIIIYISDVISVNRFHDELLDVNTYYSFRKIQVWFTYENYLAGMNGFLLYFKLFKFLTVNRRMGFFFRLFANASTDLLIFLVILFVFFFAFGTLGFIIFSSDVDAYRSFPTALRNMIRFAVTPMDYDALTESSLLSGGVYYFVWSLLMLLILSNVFIAILAQAYTEIVEEFAVDDEDDNPFEFLTNAKKSLSNLLSINLKGKTAAEQFKTIDANPDGKITGDELAKATGLDRETADKLIKEYDANGDGELDLKEFEKLREQILKDVEDIQNKQKNTVVSRQLSRPKSINAASPRATFLGIPRMSANKAQMSTQQFNYLLNEINELKDLLHDVLAKTPAGKKALKKKSKKRRKNTSNQSNGNVGSSSNLNNVSNGDTMDQS